MVSSVSPKTEHTPAKVLTVSRESTPATAVRPDNESTRQTHASAPAHRCEGCRSDRRARAAVPVGGGRARAGNIQTPRPIGGRCEACGAWPDVETTHRAGAAGVKGAGGTGGPGRGAGGRRQGQGGPRDRPLRAVRLACGDLAGGPPPTSTHSGQAHRQTIRRPEHQRRQSTTATGTATPRQAYKKPTSGSDVGLWWS